MARKSRGKKLTLTWQRGYRCHTLWQGSERVGRIDLGSFGKWDGVYRCQAGTFTFECGDLVAAKRWVKTIAVQDQIQHKLF